MRSIKRSFILNSMSSVLSQLVQLTFSFLIRKQFIEIFGIELLGINSTFADVLSLLNLTELGIGYAITYHLYSPLNMKDFDKFNKYIYIYKKFYEKVIFFILISGLIVIPFLPLLVKKDLSDLFYLAFIFLLQLFQTITSYVLSYRRVVYNVNEQNYIVSKYEAVFNFITSGLQLLVIIFFKNYFLFCFLVILKNLVLNRLLYNKAEKKFPYLNENNIDKNSVIQLKKVIKTDLKNVMIVKLGGYVLNSTDFLLISSFFGVIISGKISNYSMIFITFQVLILTAMNSVQSIIGNEAQNNNKQRILMLICKYTKIMTAICMLYCPVALSLSKDFITLWIGSKYLLNDTIPFMYSINVCLMLFSTPISLLFGALGYYKYDKTIIIMSASINFILSVILLQVYGPLGVLIGTNIAILIYWISRIVILRKIYFDDMKTYYQNIVIHIGFLIIGYCAIIYLNNFISSYIGIFQFIAKGFLYVSIMIILILLKELVLKKFIMNKSLKN